MMITAIVNHILRCSEQSRRHQVNDYLIRDTELHKFAPLDNKKSQGVYQRVTLDLYYTISFINNDEYDKIMYFAIN